jgi:hypothetical protein
LLFLLQRLLSKSAKLIHGVHKSETSLIIGVQEAIMVLVQWWSIITLPVLRHIGIVLQFFEGKVQAMMFSLLPQVNVVGLRML